MIFRIFIAILIAFNLIITAFVSFAYADDTGKKSAIIWREADEGNVKPVEKSTRNIFEKYVEPPKPVKPLKPPPPPDPLTVRKNEFIKELSHFMVSGYLYKEGSVTLFLLQGNKSFTAKKGGYIADRFLIEKINGNELILVEKKFKDRINVQINKNGTLTISNVEFGSNEKPESTK